MLAVPNQLTACCNAALPRENRLEMTKLNQIEWPSFGRKKLTTKWQLEVEENIAGLVKTMRKSVFSVKTRFLKWTWKGISQVCWREVKNSLFPSDTLIYGICRDGSKNYNIRTWEHMTRGQFRLGARATINVALMVITIQKSLQRWLQRWLLRTLQRCYCPFSWSTTVFQRSTSNFLNGHIIITIVTIIIIVINHII